MPLPGYKEVRVGLPEPFELRARWIKKRPDAIYVATESPLGKSALKAANALGIPVATGFHTNFHQYMEQYGMGGLQPVAMAYLKQFPSARGLHADAVAGHGGTTASRGLQQRPSARTRRGHGACSRPENAVNRCAPNGAREPATPVAVMVGRVAAEKNFELAMQAFERMRAGGSRTCDAWWSATARCARSWRRNSHGFISPESSPARISPDTMPPRTCWFFPARRKPSAMCCWRRWPAASPR